MFGLSLILSLPQNKNSYPALNGRGFKVYIHNQTSDPILPNEMDLNIGMELNLAITRTFSQKTPHPYSECKDLASFNSTYYSILKELNISYSQYECLKLCLQKKINEICGCYYPKYLKSSKSLEICSNLTQLDCVYSQQSFFDFDEFCLEQCPLECDTITYDVQMSSLAYPSNSVYKNLLQNATFVQEFQNYTGEAFFLASIRDYVVSLKIFYPSTSYILITQMPKTGFFDLLAQIGGSLGMLLGFSIFHLIEFFEIILLIIITLAKLKT
jgi:hypothetical protein